MSAECTLAIATQSFNGASETFIREHIRSIAPGRTVLLCNNPIGSDDFGCPVLGRMQFWWPPPVLGRRVTNGVYYRWRQRFHPGLIEMERRRVESFLGEHRPSVLLAEYGPTGLLIADACRRAGIPFYVHFHGYDASQLLTYPHTVRHYRAMFRKAAGVIAPSRYLAARLASVGCPTRLLHVNACGTNPDRFRPSKRRPGLILAVGRLTPKKAPHHTIAAFARVAAERPDARLEMVGDGPLMQTCQDLVERLGLTSKITLHGTQDPEFIARRLQQASVFVQHSVTAPNGDTEGLPVAILEAMCCALPVVSTRHSGIPESVEEGETGLLVSEHDVDGMSSAMLALLDDPERAVAMGEAGRARVLANFTVEHSRNRLREIIGLGEPDDLQEGVVDDGRRRSAAGLN